MYEDLVLIIDNLLRLASIELERQLVGIYGQLRGKRCLAEERELMTAMAHHCSEEVHFHPSGVIPMHPVFTEVCLHRHPGGRFRLLLHRAKRLLICLGYLILVPDAHHKVEHSLLAYGRKVRMMLPQMIVNLPA